MARLNLRPYGFTDFEAFMAFDRIRSYFLLYNPQSQICLRELYIVCTHTTSPVPKRSNTRHHQGSGL